MIEGALQKFLLSLESEGYEVPKEIYFPKKTYDRLQTETYMKSRYASGQLGNAEIRYYHSSSTILIKKYKCPTCGE
jgi:hypothetical protein